MLNFPKGPYPVSARFVVYRALGVVIASLASLGCMIGYGIMGWSSATGILHDQRVWAEGGPTLPASVTGEVTTRQFVLKSYRLDVEFVDPQGNPQHGKLELDTLFGGLPEAGAASVRLSQQDPTDFVLEDAVTVSSSRWAASAFLGGVGIFLLGGTCAVLAFGAARQWRRVARAARSGVPVRCAVVSRTAIVNQGRPTGNEKFVFRVPAQATNGTETQVTYQLRTKNSDAVTLDGGSSVLALVPPEAPAQAILLLRDYYPLALGNTERLQADAAVNTDRGTTR